MAASTEDSCGESTIVSGMFVASATTASRAASCTETGAPHAPSRTKSRLKRVIETSCAVSLGTIDSHGTWGELQLLIAHIERAKAPRFPRDHPV